MKRVLISVVGCTLGVVLAAVILSAPLANAGERLDFNWIGGESAQAQTADNDTISEDEAGDAALAYLGEHGLDDLTIGEVIAFPYHFYVTVMDPATDQGALELVVWRNGEIVHPAPGAGIRWNTDYDLLALVHATMSERMDEHRAMHESMSDAQGWGHGHMMDHAREFRQRMHDRMGEMGEMHGMMGGGHFRHAFGYEPGSITILDTPLMENQAREVAQTWLDENREGATATTVTTFPGYLTFHVEQDGQIAGLISVNPSTGAVWERACAAMTETE